MTRIDVYCNATDRQVIVNREWTTDYRYIKLGSFIYRDNGHLIHKVNILNEKDTDQWMLKNRISIFEKLKLRIRLVLQVWRQTK